MIECKYTMFFDLVFDRRGIFDAPSGCAPHNPDDACVIIYGCETVCHTDAEERRAAAEAAMDGQAALDIWVAENVSPVDERVADNLRRALPPWVFNEDSEACWK